MLDRLIDQELPQGCHPSVRLVGVRIRDRGEVKKLGAGDRPLRIGDYVMVEVEGDLTYGVVYTAPYTMPFMPPMRMMKSVLRKATSDDLTVIRRHERLAAEGLTKLRGKAAVLGLRLKPVEVYCAFNRRQMTFVYTAEERVDFRELVRVLARRFGGRIEMRQIGAREEASRLGGIDTCGLVLCCASFLTDIKPVTARQAKALGVAVDDFRFLGICGRLKCCLLFEAMDSQGCVERPQQLITPTATRVQ
jgi:cell fate regulator YaaT (PSP1 superfamily)